jgi:FkbM family methyltransferase
LITSWLKVVFCKKVPFKDVIQIFLFRYIFKNKPFRINNITFSDLDKTLYSTIKEIFYLQDYTPSGFEINKGDTVVDIGAHWGVFIAYAKVRGANKIIAFEPDKNNYKKTMFLIKQNNLRNITVKNLAISSKKGYMTLMSESNSRRNSLYFQQTEFPSEITYSKVQTININNALENINKIDFLKIDAEGAEFDIIKSCNKETFSKIKTIVLEYHLFDNHHIDELESILKKHYSICKNIPSKNSRLGYIYCKNDK